MQTLKIDLNVYYLNDVKENFSRLSTETAANDKLLPETQRRQKMFNCLVWRWCEFFKFLKAMEMNDDQSCDLEKVEHQPKICKWLLRRIECFSCDTIEGGLRWTRTAVFPLFWPVAFQKQID